MSKIENELELMTVQDILQALKIDNERSLYYIITHEDFPKPKRLKTTRSEDGNGPKRWLKKDIEKYIESL